ncbi:MAG: hypothetical protein J0H11_08900 [Rhizobiales bacterium]|nr:hypothetical protein [Hyphomicrobiales bacterium]
MNRMIRLLGEPAILDAEGRSQPVRGYQAWALLARVVLARAPLDRRRLAEELFPETADPLGALRWCLASLRKALETSQCLRGDPIERDFPDGITIDIRRLDEADFDVEQAGPLLGGIEPRCSPEFATWLLVERERIAGVIDARIRRDAIAAIAVSDHGRAVRLAELGARRDPYNESAHVLLVKSLACAERYEAALRHVEATEAVFADELGVKPSAALRSAARRTVSSPPAGISAATFVQSLMQSGLAALSAGATDAGIDCLRRAAYDAEKAGDTYLLASATFELGTALVHSVRGYDDEGSVLLRQSTELSRQSGYEGLAASAFRELGYVEAMAGRRPSAASYLATASEFTRDPDRLAGIHAVIGFNLVDWGQTDEGLAHYALSLDHARSAKNRHREAWSLGLGAWGLLGAGRLDEADRWLAECMKVVEAQRWLAFRPWPVAVLGETRLRQGRDPAALRPLLEEAYALSCQLGDPCWEAAIARVLALTYAATSDLALAAEWLAEARRRCTRDKDAYAALQVEILASQVEIFTAQEDGALAQTTARDWVSLAAKTHMDHHVARAAAFIAAG